MGILDKTVKLFAIITIFTGISSVLLIFLVLYAILHLNVFKEKDNSEPTEDDDSNDGDIF